MRQKDFALRRFHSLLGVLPLGLFLIQHLTVNHFATRGASAFNDAAGFMEALPYKLLLEMAMIFLPLFFHAVYGIYIAFTATNNVKQHSYFRNWMYLLQRATGIIAFIFIVWHLWGTRIAAAFGTEVNAQMMINIVDNPFMLVFYFIGVLAVIFHFANGLVTFLITWGLVVSPKSQQYASYAAGVVFLALSIVAVQTLIAFATM